MILNIVLKVICIQYHWNIFLYLWQVTISVSSLLRLKVLNHDKCKPFWSQLFFLTNLIPVAHVIYHSMFNTNFTSSPFMRKVPPRMTTRMSQSRKQPNSLDHCDIISDISIPVHQRCITPLEEWQGTRRTVYLIIQDVCVKTYLPKMCRVFALVQRLLSMEWQWF